MLLELEWHSVRIQVDLQALFAAHRALARKNPESAGVCLCVVRQVNGSFAGSDNQGKLARPTVLAHGFARA